MSVNRSLLNRWKTSYANNCKASFPATHKTHHTETSRRLGKWRSSSPHLKQMERSRRPFVVEKLPPKPTSAASCCNGLARKCWPLLLEPKHFLEIRLRFFAIRDEAANHIL